LPTLFCIIIAGCAHSWTKNNGSYAQDDGIKAMFETYDYVSGYNYFYTGYATAPFRFKLRERGVK